MMSTAHSARYWEGKVNQTHLRSQGANNLERWADVHTDHYNTAPRSECFEKEMGLPMTKMQSCGQKESQKKVTTISSKSQRTKDINIHFSLTGKSQLCHN